MLGFGYTCIYTKTSCWDFVSKLDRSVFSTLFSGSIVLISILAMSERQNNFLGFNTTFRRVLVRVRVTF